MSKTNLGRVSICPKGEYDSTVTYQPLDMVSYNGGSFLARTESKGIVPVDGDSWQAIAEITKSEIVTALGYEPQKPEGDYRLIETVTLEEDATFLRSAEPDGTAYQYSDVFLKMKRPANVAQSFAPFVFLSRNNYICYGTYMAGKSTGVAYSMLHGYSQNGYWFSECSYNSSDSMSYGSRAFSGNSYTLDRKLATFPYIEKIQSLGTIVAGTTIEIWAIKA